MTAVTTVAELIAARGGTAAMARRYAIGMSAVSNWKAANRLPARLHHRIFKDCLADGIRVDDTLFTDAADTKPPNGQPVSANAARRRSLGADIKAATKTAKRRKGRR